MCRPISIDNNAKDGGVGAVCRVFPRSFTHGGGGQMQGDKALMGGLMRGDIDLMGGGGNLTLIDYIKN